MIEIGKHVYQNLDVYLMAVALAIVFVFEMFGVFGDKYITITQIIRTYIPMWMRAMIYGWLGYHFFLAPKNF